MNLVRNNIKRDFTQIPNDLINDNSLSDRARFIFCYMAAKPDDWKFYQDKMVVDLKMSLDTVRKYIGELLLSGWITRESYREGGKFDSFIYTLHGSPCGENTESVKNRDGKKPSRKNSVLNNNELIITNTLNNKEYIGEQFVNEPAPFVSENDNLGSIPEPTPIPPVPPAPLPQSKPKKAAFIPPTLEEIKAAFVEVLKKKGSPHPEAWAESEAESFLAYWENQKFKPGKSGNWVLSLRVNTWVGNLNGRIQKAPFGVALKPQGPRLPDAPTQPTKPQPAAPKGLGLDLEAFKNRISK